MVHQRTRLKLTVGVILLAFIEGALKATIMPHFPIAEVFALQGTIAGAYIGFKTGGNISYEKNVTEREKNEDQA